MGCEVEVASRSANSTLARESKSSTADSTGHGSKWVLVKVIGE